MEIEPGELLLDRGGGDGAAANAEPARTVAEVELSFIVYSFGWDFASLASADVVPAKASASAAGTTVDRSNVLRRIHDTLGPPQRLRWPRPQSGHRCRGTMASLAGTDLTRR